VGIEFEVFVVSDYAMLCDGVLLAVDLGGPIFEFSDDGEKYGGVASPNIGVGLPHILLSGVEINEAKKFRADLIDGNTDTMIFYRMAHITEGLVSM
jgi:hypothetical protein